MSFAAGEISPCSLAYGDYQPRVADLGFQISLLPLVSTSASLTLEPRPTTASLTLESRRVSLFGGDHATTPMASSKERWQGCKGVGVSLFHLNQSLRMDQQAQPLGMVPKIGVWLTGSPRSDCLSSLWHQYKVYTNDAAWP